MLDIMQVLLSSEEKLPKREDRFSIVGEDDGKGNIILHKYYLYNPKRKSKPIIIPVKDFWGTAGSFVGGVYRAQYLPKKEGQENEKETLRKLRRFQRYLRLEKKSTTENNKTNKTKKASAAKTKKSCSSKTTAKKIPQQKLKKQ